MNTKKYWTYGWFEARLKVSDLEGAWPAFWMMPQNFKAWPDDGEIDIMEYAISTQGKDKVSSSIHCKAFNWPAGTQKTHVKQISNAASEYHVYALEWTADQMKFYVDHESPIHEEMLRHRLMELHHVDREGPMIQKALTEAINQGLQSKKFIKTGTFFYSIKPVELKPRDRSQCSEFERKLAYVAPEERALLPSSMDEYKIKQTLGLLE